MTHSSNIDRTAFDAAVERCYRVQFDPARVVTFKGEIFGATQRVRGSGDILPGLVATVLEDITEEGDRAPTTYGAAAKFLTQWLRDAGIRPVTEMTPDEVKEARRELGLTQSELAFVLDTDAQTVRRMELTENASTFRKPAPRMARLIRAYLDGYRPDDWPGDDKG